MVNLAPKQIGPIMSECLVTGFHSEDGSVVLTAPDMKLENGPVWHRLIREISHYHREKTHQ